MLKLFIVYLLTSLVLALGLLFSIYGIFRDNRDKNSEIQIKNSSPMYNQIKKSNKSKVLPINSLNPQPMSLGRILSKGADLPKVEICK